MSPGRLDAAELRAALVEHRLVAILRGPDPDRLVDCLRVLADAGVRLAEVSLTSERATTVIARAAADLGDRLELGAGTVLTPTQAREALDAGARYLVTPCAAPSAGVAAEHGVGLLAGALTPSEVLAAHDGGAAAVKVFPAATVGPSYVRALLDPFPTVPLVPVGGVDLVAAQAFLDAGAVAVGVGSPLLGDAVTGGDLGELARRAEQFLRVVS